MTRWVLAAAAALELEQRSDFLLDRFPAEVVHTVGLIADALNIFEAHSRIGRPVGSALRELVISRGKTGHLALYEYDETADMCLMLAVGHQREPDYH